MRRMLCRWFGHRIEVLGDPDVFPVDVRCVRCDMLGVAEWTP